MTYLPLVRFAKKEYLEQLQAGNLFMRNIMYYQTLEQDDTARSDVYDGAIPTSFVPLAVEKPGKVEHSRIMMPDKYVTCFFHYQKTTEDGHLCMSDRSKFELEKFGCDYALIIDTNRFLTRLNEVQCKEASLNYGDVIYYTKLGYQKEVNQVLAHRMPTNPIEFMKRDSFSSQQEFRISISHKTPLFYDLFKKPINEISQQELAELVSTTYTLDIGSIKEFS